MDIIPETAILLFIINKQDLKEQNPLSEEERDEIAKTLGQAPGKPLSEIIIEERGEV